jgi:aspartate/methionine/tyrosine aminotransferase
LAVKTNLDTPEFAVPEAHRVGVDRYVKAMMAIPASRMFEIKEALKEYKANTGDDAPTYDASQGDGGASLPGVPTAILDRAHQLQVEHGTGYDKPFGTPLFRQVAVENYWGLDAATGWGPENVIFTQGGRDGLQKAYKAMIALGHGGIGDALIVSRVPWISYNWGPYDVGLNVLRAPGHPDEGWRYTPEGIRACVKFAADSGRKVAGIVITSPDNPTGRTMPLDEQISLAHTALEAGIPFVLFDWIYHWVSDTGPNDINALLNAFSPAERERLMVLDGITKSMGASNIRSAHLLASKDVIKYINSRASHGVIPSFYAQAVAIAAYEMGFGKAAEPILGACRESRVVMREKLSEYEVPHVLGDGYYAFINVQRYIDAAGMQDSAELGAWLGRTYGVTAVPGVYFSDAGADWMRFSYALPPEKTRLAIDRFFEGLNSLV